MTNDFEHHLESFLGHFAESGGVFAHDGALFILSIKLYARRVEN